MLLSRLRRLRPDVRNQGVIYDRSPCAPERKTFLRVLASSSLGVSVPKADRNRPCRLPLSWPGLVFMLHVSYIRWKHVYVTRMHNYRVEPAARCSTTGQADTIIHTPPESLGCGGLQEKSDRYDASSLRRISVVTEAMQINAYSLRLPLVSLPLLSYHPHVPQEIPVITGVGGIIL